MNKNNQNARVRMQILIDAVLIIAAYLFAWNLRFRTYWFPSTVLMGDAGSRTIGFFLALLSMKSGHPFAFLLLSLVFIIDGGLGLVKLTLLRTIHADPFKNIRLPLHDHMRKNKNWSIPKIVIFFALCQIVMSVITGVIIHVFSR